MPALAQRLAGLTGQRIAPDDVAGASRPDPQLHAGAQGLHGEHKQPPDRLAGPGADDGRGLGRRARTKLV